MRGESESKKYNVAGTQTWFGVKGEAQGWKEQAC